ncbi:MAG: hypothetical protein RLY21_2076 [Planctomycetota bacterium]
MSEPDHSSGTDPSQQRPLGASQPTSQTAEDTAASPQPRDRRLLASGILGLLWISLPPLAGIYILLDLQDIARFLQQDLSHGFWAYVAVFAITAGLGLLPTYSQSFLGGWVFGMQWGLLGAIVGFTGGAAIGYLFARLVTGDSVDRWIDRHPRGRVIRDALARGSTGRTFLIVTLLRLPPNSPFAMTNYALSATRVPFWLAMTATPIGMLPRTAIVCFLAAAAVSEGAQNIKEAVEDKPLWALVFAIGSSIAAIAIMGQLANKALAKLAKHERPVSEGTDAGATSG